MCSAGLCSSSDAGVYAVRDMGPERQMLSMQKLVHQQSVGIRPGV